MKFRIFTGVIVTTILAAPVQLAAQEPESNNHHRYSLMSLASLGGTSSGASSINNRNWVGGFSNLSGDSTQHAVVWAGGEIFDLGTLGGPNSSVAWPNHNDHAVVGIAETPNLDPLGERWSCAAFFPSSTGHTCLGFVWRDGVMSPLPTLGGNNGYAAGANRLGQIVGWAETAVHDPTCIAPQVLQFEAVIWGPRGDEIQQLPPLPGDPDSAATAINDRGEVAGFSDLPGDDPNHPNFHAFRWTRRGGIEDLGTLPGDRLSLAFGINEGGQVVGQSIGGSGSRAFLWENGVMVDLNALVPPGSPFLIYANDVNDAGRIVGQAYDQSTGEFFSFVAVPRGHEDEG